ncbi:MAG: hypothetical protein ABII64_06100 [Elusimicrobiota bacterium]
MNVPGTETGQIEAEQANTEWKKKSLFKKMMYIAGACAALVLFLIGIYGTVTNIYSIKNTEMLRIAKRLNIKAEDVLKNPNDYINKPVLWKFKFIEMDGLGLTQEGGVNVSIAFGRMGGRPNFLLNEKGEHGGTVLGIVESVNEKLIFISALDAY